MSDLRPFRAEWRSELSEVLGARVTVTRAWSPRQEEVDEVIDYKRALIDRMGHLVTEDHAGTVDVDGEQFCYRWILHT